MTTEGQQLAALIDLIIFPQQTPDQRNQGLVNFQQLRDLVTNPQQTPEQLAAGEVTFLQLRDAFLKLQTDLFGNPTGGVPSYDQVRQHAKEMGPIIARLDQFQATQGPIIAKLDQAQAQQADRTKKLEDTLEPILNQASQR